MKKTLQAIARVVAVPTPPLPPDRETLDQVDSLPILTSWESPRQTDDRPVSFELPATRPPTDSTIRASRRRRRRHVQEPSIDSLFIRGFDVPSTPLPFRHPPPYEPYVSPPSSPLFGAEPRNASANAGSQAGPSGSVGATSRFPSLPQRSVTIWERRSQWTRGQEEAAGRTDSPPRVAATTSSGHPDVLTFHAFDDLPSPVLRRMVDDYINTRARDQGRRSTALPDVVIGSGSTGSVPGPPNVPLPPVPSMEQPEGALPRQPSSTATVRALGLEVEHGKPRGRWIPDSFYTPFPSPRPARTVTRRHSTSTIVETRRSPTETSLPADHIFSRSRAGDGESTILNTSIDFEDAIMSFGDAASFDFNSGTETRLQNVDTPESTNLETDKDVPLHNLRSFGPLMDLSGATEPRRHSVVAVELKSAYFNDSSKPLPYLPSSGNASPSRDPSSNAILSRSRSFVADSPPRLPALDIPTITLGSDLWDTPVQATEFEEDDVLDPHPPLPSVGRLQEPSPPLVPPRPPRSAKRLKDDVHEADLVPLPAFATDNDRTPARTGQNIFKRLSEPLFRRLQTRPKRRPFESVDLAPSSLEAQRLREQRRQAEHARLESEDERARPDTPRPISPQSDLRKSVDVQSSESDTTPRASPPLDSATPLLAGEHQLDRWPDPDENDESDEDEDLALMGDILAAFPRPPTHTPQPFRTPPVVERRQQASSSNGAGRSEPTPDTHEVLQTPLTAPRASRSSTRDTRPDMLLYRTSPTPLRGSRVSRNLGEVIRPPASDVSPEEHRRQESIDRKGKGKSKQECGENAGPGALRKIHQEAFDKIIQGGETRKLRGGRV
ncbi:hypothetical protein BD324DRAFT_119242 [Kockovaella imperatae]|uniref:Uncharacterized protein n=1 Tax=Kockovaella imperatae TaxID=4999 RepID=A0A1Y1UC71_9TREE|nr:hypothetical protein BD324DRAFT_119242 [Kockovaella imperatae]ORX35127.1 hypothetical protein BD324DRAFT_119242 [Kockovaella imperatae]